LTSFILSINKSSRIATTIKTASRQIGTGDGVIRISPVLNNCQRDIMSHKKGIE